MQRSSNKITKRIIHPKTKILLKKTPYNKYRIILKKIIANKIKKYKRNLIVKSTQNIQTIVPTKQKLPKGTPFRKALYDPLHYINKFMHNHAQIISFFPNAKEITETMGILECLYYKLNVNRQSPTTTCYVLGDGTTPRTAATVVISSLFTVYSIDPILKTTSKHIKDKNIKSLQERLNICKCKSEEFTNINKTATLSIILAVHSHAPLNEFWLRVPSPKIAISIPCCVPQFTDIEPSGFYVDDKIFSEKNKVVYWMSN